MVIDPRQRTLLRAGRIRMAFVEGRLQWLSVGDVEMVRRIYVALRDDAWTTVPFDIERLEVEVEERAFALTYEAIATSARGTFDFRVEIRGDPGDALEVSMRGEARTVLTTNRVGLCLHYPHELAGTPLRSWHVDDPNERDARFPTVLKSTPPLKGLGGISHPVDATAWCRVSLHGDVFEMEDQRNFGDASYKVYSTPSSDPIPRVLQPGDRIEQRIVVELVDAPARASERAAERPAPRFLGSATLPRASVVPPQPGGVARASAPTPTSTPRRRDGADGRPVQIEVSEQIAGSVPVLGTDVSHWCRASHTSERSDMELRAATELLAALGVATIRLELDLSDPAWRPAFDNGARLAEAAAVGLDLVFGSEGRAWPEDLAKRFAGRAAFIGSVCITQLLDDPSRLADRVRRLREAIERFDVYVPVGAGSPGWFIEVNGADLPIDDLDFLAYAYTPQVHVFDDDALRENLHGLEPALATARSMARGRAVHVGPVTLRPRGEGAGATRALWPDARDPRLDEAFGAVWTLGAIDRCSAGGAAAVTLFELMGPEAISENGADATAPSTGSIGGVIRELGSYSGSEALQAGSSSPLDAFALAVRTTSGGVCWLANPTARAVEVELHMPDVAGHASGRVRLSPYGVHRVVWADEG